MDNYSQQDELLARHGHEIVDGTGTIATIPHYGIVFREDTVVATWVVYNSEGTAFNLVDRFGMSGKTYTKDDPALIVPMECRGANKHSFSLTSGSVNMLKKI